MNKRLVGIFLFIWILTLKQNSLHNNMRYYMGKKNKNEKINNEMRISTTTIEINGEVSNSNVIGETKTVSKVDNSVAEPSVAANTEQCMLDTLNEIKSILNAMQVSMAKIAGRY